jgi:hypothetical protein
VLDEAHCLRDLDTQTSLCLRWFRREFNLLLTATPMYNTIHDILGIAAFILNPDQPTPDVLVGFHPLHMDAETLPILFTLGGLRKHVFGNRALDGIAKGLALRPIFERCVIRRSLSSRIPFHTGKEIGDTIPVQITRGLSVKLSQFEQALYNRRQVPLIE